MLFDVDVQSDIDESSDSPLIEFSAMCRLQVNWSQGTGRKLCLLILQFAY